MNKNLVDLILVKENPPKYELHILNSGGFLSSPARTYTEDEIYDVPVIENNGTKMVIIDDTFIRERNILRKYKGVYHFGDCDGYPAGRVYDMAEYDYFKTSGECYYNRNVITNIYARYRCTKVESIKTIESTKL